jgi:hypothetical protein
VARNAKQPYVSVTAKFTFKNPPPGFQGVTFEDWGFGRETPTHLRSLIYYLVLRLVEFYASTVARAQGVPDADIMAEVRAAAGLLLGLCPADSEPTPGDSQATAVPQDAPGGGVKEA